MRLRRVTRSQLLERVRDLETAAGQMLADLARGARPEYAAVGYAGRVYRMVRNGMADREPAGIAMPGGGHAGFLDRLHPDDAESAFRAIQDHVAGRMAQYDAEYRLRAGDQWRKCREHGMVTLRDEEGGPLLLAADLYDVTDTAPGGAPGPADGGNKAELDGLTGIKSHDAMVECLEEAAARAEFLKEPLSVIMLDIDDFRNFNDALGSAVGDSALRDVARIIRMNVRETDMAGRYGGEEFLVLLPRTDALAAEAVAERIRAEIAMNEFSASIPITVSGGVMQYGGESLEYLVKETNNALLTAKAAGKNRIVVRQAPIPQMSL